MNLPRINKKWLFATLMVLVGIWLAASLAVAYRFTHRQRPIAVEPPPSTAWGEVASFQISSSDGEQLGAWFIDGDETLPIVLFLHGNGACRSNCASSAEILVSNRYPVLMLSLRCHGDSTGEFNDFGYSARHDVLAAVDWLSQHHPEKQIVVWGQSLGSAAAIFAAKQLENRVSGYIFECPYQDLHTAV